MPRRTRWSEDLVLVGQKVLAAEDAAVVAHHVHPADLVGRPDVRGLRDVCLDESGARPGLPGCRGTAPKRDGATAER